MHGVYDLTWAWLRFLVAAVAERKKSYCTCISQRATKGRAGLQSDFLFLYIGTFCLELSSAKFLLATLLSPVSLHLHCIHPCNQNRNSFLHLRRYIKFLHLFQQLHFCIHSPKQFMNFPPSSPVTDG